MDKSKLISLAMVATLATGTVFAEPQDGKDRGPRHAGPDMAPQLIERIGRAIRTLDLSDQQREDIRSELQGLKESMKPLVQSMHQNRKDLHELITADSYDSASVTDVAEQQGAITAQMTILASAAAANVLALLDEEQRTQLKNMAEERREFRADHKDWVKARKQRHRNRQDAPPPEDS